MSVIFSIAVLAFVAYDFFLLSRMRKAINAALEATSELEDLLRARPTAVGEIVVDLKIDTSQAAEAIRNLTLRPAAGEVDGPFVVEGGEVRLDPSWDPHGKRPETAP